MQETIRVVNNSLNSIMIFFSFFFIGNIGQFVAFAYASIGRSGSAQISKNKVTVQYFSQSLTPKGNGLVLDF